MPVGKIRESSLLVDGHAEEDSIQLKQKQRFGCDRKVAGLL